jgi:hypothetical protein
MTQRVMFRYLHIYIVSFDQLRHELHRCRRDHDRKRSRAELVAVRSARIPIYVDLRVL